MTEEEIARRTVEVRYVTQSGNLDNGFYIIGECDIGFDYTGLICQMTRISKENEKREFI